MKKLGILMVVLAVGCAESHTLPREDRGTGSVATDLVDNAWMAGEMQTVGHFDADAFEVTPDEYGVTIHVSNDEGWAMAALSTTDGIETLEPGTHLDTDEGDYVYVTGCSGPSQWDYDWDGGANRVIVDVEQGELDGDRLVSFEVEYPEGQRTEGGFVYHAE